jgi:hypothetical protein
MASYCSKCGSELSAGSQFCTKCGAPMAGAPSVGASAPLGGNPPAGGNLPVGGPVPYAGQQPMVAPPAPAGGNTLKIVLIIVAVVVGLGIIGVSVVGYTAYRIARHTVHVNDSTGEVSIRTPEGTLSANTKGTYTAAELGIDIYPGATAAEGGMRMSVPDGTMVTGVFATSDAQDKVVSFYKGKVSSEASIMETGEGAVITAKTGEKESLIITVTANSDKNDGKTRIQIVHTTSNKAS